VCGNPGVISKLDDKMVQPAGIFFQLYGHRVPSNAKVVIRKVDMVDGNRTETILDDVQVSADNLKTIISPTNGSVIINGKAVWESNVVINRTSTYTAEVVIDNDFRSKQVDIPRQTIPKWSAIFHI
jgi:hypothetical protein